MASHRAGVRTIAVFEAIKGALVLLAGFGLFALVHHDVQSVAEQVVRHFHLNPASRTPRIFLDLTERLSDHRMWVMALLACCYAAARLVEAYGLWRGRRWAEWFAVVSSGMYLPIELYELAQGVTVIRFCLFTVNLGIVLFMASELRSAGRKHLYRG